MFDVNYLNLKTYILNNFIFVKMCKIDLRPFQSLKQSFKS